MIKMHKNFLASTVSMVAMLGRGAPADGSISSSAELIERHNLQNRPIITKAWFIRDDR